MSGLPGFSLICGQHGHPTIGSMTAQARLSRPPERGCSESTTAGPMAFKLLDRPEHTPERIGILM
jgi:hypothetical protein